MNQPVTDQIVEWLKSQPQGVTARDTAPQFGIPMKRASVKLSMLRKAGRIQGVIDHYIGSTKVYRYFDLSATMPEPPPQPQPKSRTAQWNKANRLRKAAPAEVVQPARGATLPGEAIIPKGLKIHRAETPKDRFHVDKAPSIFGSLAVGSYLPSETHLSKVYGG